MIALILTCLIVTQTPTASTGGGSTIQAIPAADKTTGKIDAIDTIFATDFGDSADADFDGWPHLWTRRSGPGFPAFNRIALCDQAPPGGKRSLRIELDGGGALAYSPPFSLSTLCDYLAEVQVKTEDVVKNRVFVSFNVLDGHGKAVETFYSEKLAGSPQWSVIRLGPVSPDAREAASAVLGLHVEPAAKADLKCAAMFGQIRIGRLPRVALVADSPRGFYVDPQRPRIRARVSGLSKPKAHVAWELSDAYGHVVSRASLPLKITTSAAAPKAVETPEQQARHGSDLTLASGEAEWLPPAPGPGFYRVRATLEPYPPSLLHRESTLAILNAARTPSQSPFGWSLPRGERLMPRKAVADVLEHSAARWLKYPIWLDSDSSDAAAAAVTDFVRDLASKGIAVVGVLGRPPADVAARFDLGRPPWAAEIFASSREVWATSLERTVAATAGRVRFWQLGGDDDVSFVGYPDLEAKVDQVKRELDRIGRGLHVGIGWASEQRLPTTTVSPPPWRFISIAPAAARTEAKSDASPTAAPRDPGAGAPRDLGAIASTPSAGFDRWIVVRPLARSKHPLENRVRDLVEQMLAATTSKADAVFAWDPFDEEHGLLGDDGSPRELFIPWRTAALALAGATPLESVRLPGGSMGHVFARNHDAVMVAWSTTPTDETWYLGENVRHVDAWGIARPVESVASGQRIRVTPMPSFVTGLNKPIAVWRQRFRLGHDRIASVFNQRQTNRLEFENTFDQPVSGRATWAVPSGWTIRPDRFDFSLKPAEKQQQDFEVTLPSNVLAGDHEIRLDFELSCDFGSATPRQSYRFSVARSIRVGLTAVRIEFVTRLNGRGELEVKQKTSNEGPRPIGLRCELFAPGRQRLANQIESLTQTPINSTYRIPEGRALVGKTLWLQVQELEGPEVLNYRFIVQP